LSPHEEISDAVLVGRLNDGSIEAFDTIYHRYKQRVYGLVIKIIKSKEESEGLVHDCFIQLWEKRSDLVRERSLRQWLFTVAYNLSIDRLRYLSVRSEYVTYLKGVLHEPSLETEHQVNFSDLQKQIDEIVAGLPEKRRRIFLLSRMDGLSNKEIADRLGISQNTVENQLVSVLKTLRSALKAFRSLLMDHLL